MRKHQALKWIALALLVLVLAWFFAPDAPQEDLALPLATPKTETQTTPATKQEGHSGAERNGRTKGSEAAGAAKGGFDTGRSDTVSAQTCELIAGAAEDVRDVCPSNQVEQILENCAENLVQNPEGVPERRYRCQQKGNCRICGDDLARRYEITR